MTDDYMTPLRTLQRIRGAERKIEDLKREHGRVIRDLNERICALEAQIHNPNGAR